MPTPSTITITFNNATFTSSIATIVLAQNTGSFEITSNNFIQLAGSFTFSALNISSNLISFDVASGAAVNGTVQIPAVSTNNSPLLTVSNFAGTATVGWPTGSSGPQLQTLTPGDAITLSDFAS